MIILRFSPYIGITSDIVPIVAETNKSLYISQFSKSSIKTEANLKATPAPHKSKKG